MRRTFRQAQHVWDEVEAEMALHLDAIHADIFDAEDVENDAVSLLGAEPWATGELRAHEVRRALGRLGIAGPGRLYSRRDRECWFVPASRRPEWDLICRAIVSHQTAEDRKNLVESQIRPGWVRPRVHVGYAATGRSHIETPRLQGLGKKLIARYIDLPTLTVDQSRAEPTVLAHLSQDAVLAADLRGDPYAALASDLGIDRATAKRIFMSVPYGSGAARITRELGIDEDAAQAVIDGWRTRYADAAAWCDDRVAEARSGVVRLYDGTELRPGAPYLGPSHVGQGTGALLTHEWTVAAHEALPAGASLAWPVHDALVVEVADESVRDEAGRVLCDLLDDLTIPLRGEIEMETNDDD